MAATEESGERDGGEGEKKKERKEKREEECKRERKWGGGKEGSREVKERKG